MHAQIKKDVWKVEGRVGWPSLWLPRGFVALEAKGVLWKRVV